MITSTCRYICICIYKAWPHQTDDRGWTMSTRLALIYLHTVIAYFTPDDSDLVEDAAVHSYTFSGMRCRTRVSLSVLHSFFLISSSV